MTRRTPCRVLVTGAAGFVGSYVTDLLKEEGDTVIGIGLMASGAHHDVFHDLSSDDDPPTLEADHLIHLAAESGGIQIQHDEALYRNNVKMTQTAIEIARRAGVGSVVLASSAVVYQDGADNKPINEHGPTLSPGVDAISPYAWSKLTTEVLGRWFATYEGQTVVAGRFTTIYGPGGSIDPAVSSVVHALVDRSLSTPVGAALSVWGSGVPVRSFLHVEDAARAIVLMSRLENPAPVYNVASGDPMTIRHLAELVVEITERDQSIVFDKSQAEGSLYRGLDTTLLESEGFKPRWSLRSGLRATVDWRLARVDH